MAPLEIRAMEIEEAEVSTGSHPRTKLALAVAGAIGLLGLSAASFSKHRPEQNASGNEFHAESLSGDFTFEQFAQKYQRTYVVGTEEYAHRAAVFKASLAEIEAINTRNAKRDDQFWRAGPNHFMDWTVEERRATKGYKKGMKKKTVKAMTTGTDQGGDGPPAGWQAPEKGGMEIGDPRSPEVRDQGGCGSCWAFASAEAAEAYILKADEEKQYSPSQVVLSREALVDCIANDEHCGGTGGCQGATMDLAFQFMRDHGIPLETELPYTGEDGECVEPDMQGTYPAPKVARVTGWRTLESNVNQLPLMYELLKGPVTVAVAADDWFWYFGGVFNCNGATSIDHAVLAKGFGKDVYDDVFGRQHTKLYWLIQNSWGPGWGEEGHIRLQRAPNDADVCGTDMDTSSGLACDGDNLTATVCGACGILYDAVVPDGVTLDNSGARLAFV